MRRRSIALYKGRPRRAAPTGHLVATSLFLLLGCSFAQDASIDRARALLLHGDYKAAISAFSSMLEKNATDKDARIGLLQALIATGDYAGAENKAKAYLGAKQDDASLQNILGKVLFQTGRYQESATQFERAAAAAGPAGPGSPRAGTGAGQGSSSSGAEWLNATLGRARALLAQGKGDDARSLLQGFVAYFNSNRPATAPELTLIAHGMALLENYKDANELYQDAREADKTYAEAYIGQGQLLNEKYIYGDAASLFKDALKINPNSTEAQLGLAESTRLESTDQPRALAIKALEVNANSVDALMLRAWFDLEADNSAAADDALRKALAVNPNSIKALAVQAAIAYIADHKPELDSLTKRALAINPNAGEFFDTLSHFAMINRRYADAVEFDKRAVALSPHLWAARTELGIELLRLGRGAEGRAELERAFAGDPYNPWAKNTLDLLDSMREYHETVRGPFLLKCAEKESGVVSAYAADLLEEAYKTLSAKYKFTPRAPITIEMFPNHEDFAVRALGVPGLGALGVCFGQVIAMDGPTAREVGQFNWGSTLWHEFTHVITLEMTDHRIPRWFSEGLSVYEENRARPGWGEKWNIDRIKAFAGGKFVKIADLDGAFTRPKSPDQIPLAYFQASLVCDFVEEKFGFDAILRMLSLYKNGTRTPEVLQTALSLSPADFDKSFGDYVRSKVSGYLEALANGPGAAAGPPSKEALVALVAARPNDYFGHFRLGTIYKNEGDVDHAIEQLGRASELFPFYAGENNPYIQLADIYKSRGQKAEEAAALESLARIDDTGFAALGRLARLRLDAGDKPGALEALKAGFFVNPLDSALHKLAGDIYLEQGNARQAVGEFRVVVALAPADAAAAHYDLARSLAAAGQPVEARHEVLRSLEIAPGFEKAQDLLLKLKSGG
ncbi:MAG TPA: tetratricopeptide repeat protein [Blastocatellia bacterium]|nr:tetratricopeptide repeat protein [Blastocatellia bacterium]